MFKMFKKSFRKRLITIFLLTTLIPIGLFGISISGEIERFTLSNHDKSKLNNVKYQSAVASAWFSDKINTINNASESIREIDKKVLMSRGDANSYLKRLQNNSEDFLNIFFTLESGFDYDALNTPNLKDGREREWYKAVKSSGRLFVSKPYNDYITGEQVITIAVPILDKSGMFVGAMGGDILMKTLIDIVNTFYISETTEHAIVDADDSIIWASRENLLDREHTEYIKKNEGSFVRHKMAGEDYIGIYTKIESLDWGIITLSDVTGFYAKITKIRTTIILISLGAIILLLISAVIASKKIAKPMVELRDAVERVSHGDYEVSVDREYNDELGEVISAFNQMAATINENEKSLNERTKQLIESNSLLQDMNAELEASYEQLQATTLQLNDSEERYRLLIDNMRDLVWVINEDGAVSFVNPALSKILGYRQEDVIGKHITEILCPYYKYIDCENIVEYMLSQENDRQELWMLKADKVTRVLMDTKTNKLYNNGRLVGLQGIGRDITEMKKLQEQIIQKNVQLTFLNEISSSLANMVYNTKTTEILDIIAQGIVDMMNVSVCTIRLLDEHNRLEYKVAKGELGNMVTREAIPISADMIGRAVLEKRTVIVENFTEYSGYSKHINQGKPLAYVIFVPLKIGDEVIGTITVGSQSKLDDINVATLISLSNYAAVAIEKSELYHSQKEGYLKTIRALAAAVEAKDTYTKGHSTRVSQYAVLISKYLGLEARVIEEIEIAGILHDIGKIGISDSILTKPGRLNKEEYEAIKCHPNIGRKILEPVGLSKNILNAVLLHHKRHDLKGYPDNVIIEELPIEAEIIGVADAFDAMTSHRSYKMPMSVEEAIKELKQNSGTQFSPDLVKAMEEIFINDRHLLYSITPND